LKAYEAFQRALESFVEGGEKGNIEIFESPPGVLWANIGTQKFNGVSSTDRQEMIWKHLRDSLSVDDLRHCWGVQCMDVSEYRESLTTRQMAYGGDKGTDDGDDD
jgi:hypothetical protein